MPAELEQQLRALVPTCTATRVRDVRLLRRHRIEMPCTDSATHALHVVCDGTHEAYPTQLMCTEHHGMFERQQAVGAKHSCWCGGTLVLRMVAL